MTSINRLAFLVGISVAGASFASQPSRIYSAAEARQGVAVDASFFYAIDNRAIGKYDRTTGERVAQWHADDESPLVHLNGGVVVDGRLYCAHSNYPGVPMTSSIEIWEASTLRHIGSHSFGITDGSATWIDRFDGSWWVAFAHYAGRGGVPDRGPEWSYVARFDDQWRKVAAWALPEALVAKLAPYSNSGGSWSADRRLHVTGHDGDAIYLLSVPAQGARLIWHGTVRAPIDGQGIAWARSDPVPLLFGVRRNAREVVAWRP